MITLVLGGARSGKSAVAERLAGEPGELVAYLATGTPTDEDMKARIEAHRSRRPAGWHTVEAGHDLVGSVAAIEGIALIDSLGTWVAGAAGFVVDVDGLCRALRARPGDTVVVSEEVGLGVHPSTEPGRRFRDILGEVNQAVAEVADQVLLVVAGRVLHLDRL